MKLTLKKQNQKSLIEQEIIDYRLKKIDMKDIINFKVVKNN